MQVTCNVKSMGLKIRIRLKYIYVEAADRFCLNIYLIIDWKKTGDVVPKQHSSFTIKQPCRYKFGNREKRMRLIA